MHFSNRTGEADTISRFRNTLFTSPKHFPSYTSTDCSLKYRPQLEPEVVAFEAIFHLDFRKLLQFCREVFTPDLRYRGEHRADPDHTALEITEGCTRAAVAADLLVVETACSYAEEAAQKRQMLGDRDVEVKLSSALVIRFVVFGVKVHAGESGQLKTYLAADVAERGSRLERPVVLAHVASSPLS